MDLDDYQARLSDAVRTLQVMARDSVIPSEQARLRGKVEGVQLALSYVYEAQRVSA